MRPYSVLLSLGMLGIGVWLAAPAASNSDGAPDPSFDSGCTCHGSDSSAVQVVLTGPAEYEAGATYDLMLRIAGGPMVVPVVSQHQGGFAAKVDVGAFAAGAGTQLKLEGRGITHTLAGSGARSWSFQWVAPEAASGNATFTYWGNAVNGDTTTRNDMWAKGNVLVVPPKAVANATANATDEAKEGTPSVSMGAALAAMVLVAVWTRRRLY